MLMFIVLLKLDLKNTKKTKNKNVYVNSFFPRTAEIWNSLPIECFPLTYDLRGFKFGINYRFFLNRFLIFLCFLFL